MPTKIKKRRSHHRSRSSRHRNSVRWFKGRRIPRKVFNRMLAAAVACFLVTAGLIFTLVKPAFQEDRMPSAPQAADAELAGPVIPRTLVALDEAQTPLVVLLNEHYASLPRDEVKSLSFSGKYHASEIEYHCEVYAKNSRQFRQTIQQGKVELMAGFDGANYWETINREVQAPGDTDMHRLNVHVLAMESAFYAIPWAYQEGGLQVFSLESDTQEVAGRSCRVLQSKYLLPVPVRHFIDAETSIEWAREAKVTLGENTYTIYIEYRYKPSESTTLVAEEATEDAPRYDLAGYSVRVDDVVYAECEIEQMRFNLGMPNWFFTP